jgi:hypothetical protein
MILAALAGPSASANASALVHSFENYFEPGMSKPEAIAVDQTTGDFYVVEHDNGCLARFKGRGAEALTGHVFPATGTNKICGLDFKEEASETEVAIDNSGTSTEGTIYVNTYDETPTGGVQIYDINGNHIGNLPQHALGDPYVYQCGVTTDSEGNVYVAEHYSNYGRYKHDTPVTDADFEGGPYVGPICSIAIDSVGDKYYAFPTDGPMIRQVVEAPYGFLFTELGFAVTIDPSSDDVYISEGKEVTGYNYEGVQFDSFGFGDLTEARGVAIDKETGTAYVSDTANDRVAVFKGETAYRLAVEPTGTGFGSVTASKPPITGCGDEGQCSGYYTPQNIVLTATPQPHSVVGGWSGCTSVNLAGDQCTVNMSEDKEVTATFTRKQQTLTVALAGTGTGSVSTPNHLGLIHECGDGGICSGPYDEGSVVGLIPTPTGHSAFTGWSGACTNATGNCEVVMEGPETATAHFTAQHPIAVSKIGTGAGSVSDESGRLTCGGKCTVYFTDGETVHLTALAAAHSKFVGFSGEGCSGTTCEVTAGGGLKRVFATFAHDPPVAVTHPGVTFVGQHAGTLHGDVNPEGAKVSSCLFEYGTTTAYGSSVQCAPSDVGSGTNPVEIGANLSNLAAGTTYHYRLSATSPGGTAYGGDQTFRTLDDTCDSNAALCPPPVTRHEGPKCKSGFVLRKGHCVKRRHHRSRKRHHRRQGGTR